MHLLAPGRIRATGDDDCRKVAAKIDKADIFTDLCIASDLDAERLNHLDFRTDEFSGQPTFASV